ncbi:MAG: DUF4126 family protein [Acidobacteriaceae bacterium]
MPMTILLLLCVLIGGVSGLRSMMGIALVCWGAHLGWLSLGATRLGFLASPISLIVFSLLAVGELVADKLPAVPPRVQAGPLVVRIVFGACAASALAMAAGASFLLPAVVGGVAALCGTFIGYSLRKLIVNRGKVKDLLVAPVEDVVAILLGLFAVSRF